jgi:hypothetical protein
MQHAGQPHVLHIGRAARDLGRDVDPKHGCVQDLERRRVAQLRHGLRLHMLDGFPDERPVRETAPIGCDHGPVLGFEFVRWQVQLARSLVDQQFAHLRCGVADGGAAVLHRMAAGSISLIRRAAGVRRNNRQPLHG